MPAKTAEPKFLRISTDGFVPLSDATQSAACKLLESQLKELAKGSFHDEVGPDPSLKGKSVTAFLGMIANGEVGLLGTTETKAGLRPEIAYVANGLPTRLALTNPQMFVVPPVLEPKLEGDILKVRVDLRIELKNMIRSAACGVFIKAANEKQISDIIWTFRASKKIDPLGYACQMFQQKASLYSFDFFPTKKPLVDA